MVVVGEDCKNGIEFNLRSLYSRGGFLVRFVKLQVVVINYLKVFVS